MTKKEIVFAVFNQSKKFEDLIENAEQIGGVSFKYTFTKAEELASVCANKFGKQEALDWGDIASVQFVYSFKHELGCTGEVMSPMYKCRIKNGSIVDIYEA